MGEKKIKIKKNVRKQVKPIFSNTQTRVCDFCRCLMKANHLQPLSGKHWRLKPPSKNKETIWVNYIAAMMLCFGSPSASPLTVGVMTQYSGNCCTLLHSGKMRSMALPETDLSLSSLWIRMRAHGMPFLPPQLIRFFLGQKLIKLSHWGEIGAF